MRLWCAKMQARCTNEPSGVQSQTGVPHVFGTFQEAFHKQRKGKGHEASDLGRLLDMYERWAQRLFPHCDWRQSSAGRNT